jgi:hypothetical protein
MKAAKCIATMRIADVFEESKEYRDRLGFIVRYYYGYREAAPLSVLDRMNKLLTEQEKMMDGKQARLFP